MYKLSSVILFLGLTINLLSQSPHGAQFRVNCADCHSSDSWEIPFDAWDRTGPVFSRTTGWQIGWDTARFSHTKTDFPLTGQHVRVDCRDCHGTLVFADAGPNCISCHTDMHNGTVGSDCARCHNTENWLVDNIPELHQENGFPLVGAHALATCTDCHKSETGLQFNRIGNDCVNCHLSDFTASTNPDHKGAGFSTNCVDCHDLTGFDWTTDKVNHDFFPLTKGHDIADCAQCHTGGNYSNTTADCISCHKNDYETAINPNHTISNFSQNCLECHTTDPDWMPAIYSQHDAEFFPIYSGSHKGEWDKCADCHTNPSNYAEFTCITCHENPETDNEHSGVNGYSYNSPACLACHPTGNGDDVFDHNNTGFPLTGAHVTAACLDCHASGYAGTPKDCASCHSPDYNQSANPKHVALTIPTDCASCHTTGGWEPATFAIHNNYYPLNGAHAAIANDCATCHNGDYNNTPNTCSGCHTNDYNQTTSPNHATAQLPTDCIICHNETAWVPSTFDHNSFYPLTGAHAAIADDCNACHHGDYTNTPNTCAGCHTPDYSQSTNPNHTALAIPTDCAICHSTSGWEPATFAIHNNYYPLNGAHAAIANDCAACHNGNYVNTPNTCADCHTDDYNQTNNPNHAAAQFPTDCASCHNETAWVPTAFDHDGQYFPIYSGKHNGEWDQCADCHTNPSNYAEFTCTTCHTNPETNNEHNGVNGYSYNSPACLACHPTGDGDDVFDHNNTNFPLTGAHLTADCLDCHASGYAGTPTDCASCHTSNYNQSANPNHAALAIPTDCATCHTTGGWEPATFAIHNNYYPLTGAHAAIANDCAVCHNGDYVNTPNTCAGCHTSDYDQSTNPNHAALAIPTDCATCHTTDGWEPAAFPIHNNYYALNGAHAAIANDCATCHNGNYVNTPNTCAGCHTDDYNQTVNPNHAAAQFPTDCASCHSETAWAPSTFDHNSFYPLTGAHAAIANDCNACHNGNYVNTPNTCAGCHIDDYNQTVNPNHAAAQFPTDCASCHSETAWVPSTFDHNSFYPLTGAHAAIANDCNACHNGNYVNTPNTCAGCHTPDYDQSTNPNHAALAIPTDCATCHTTGGWEPAAFPIHNNYYALNGAHVAIANDCAVCHNGNYVNTPNTCAGCHTDDYNQTVNPNHAAAQFPTDCASCHSETAWVPSTFDHNSFYPLNGAHAAIANDCNACHNGNYVNTPNTCAGCHTDDYNQTVNPNHAAAQFPTDCASCHSETAWVPSTFDHNSFYPLTGAHAAIANDCNACHNGNYVNTPNTCAGCHTPDYDQSTNPNHAALAIPTDCADCHTTDGWEPAAFPIHNNYYALNGAHAAIANDCAACHNGNYVNTPNTCAGCHIDDYNQTVNPNHVAAQFPTNCASCHDETAWVPSTFDHSVFYPLNGAHAALNCNDCHINGNYVNTPNTCYGCHQSDYNQANNPNHAAAGFPTSCQDCHNETAWVPSTFDHDDMYFPIYSGKHEGEWDQCIDCHINPNDFSVFSCTVCHLNPETNNDHQGVPGYVYSSPACYSCHPTGDD